MSTRLWLLPWFAILAVAVAGLGQNGERPASKLFGAATPKVKAEDPRRLAEIGVELAWLADPVTFPYFLEAKVEGATLTVRGFVPDKAVRDYALRLARLYCSCSVTDAMKEHPSLRVRPGQAAPTQLQTAVVSALREALSRQQAQKLQVQCAADGKVTLGGPVQSAEAKLAASRALRRMYGCTSVQNLTQAPGAPDLGLVQAAPQPKGPAAKDSSTLGDTGPRPFSDKPLAKKDDVDAKTDRPPTPPTKVVEGPNLFTKGTEIPVKEAPVKDAPVPGATDKAPAKLALSPTQIAMLQKCVKEVCTEVKDVKIEVAKNKLRVELTVRTEDQVSTAAEKVFNVPELAEYREALELVFAVSP
jgi:BON domain